MPIPFYVNLCYFLHCLFLTMWIFVPFFSVSFFLCETLFLSSVSLPFYVNLCSFLQWLFLSMWTFVPFFSLSSFLSKYSFFSAVPIPFYVNLCSFLQCLACQLQTYRKLHIRIVSTPLIRAGLYFIVSSDNGTMQHFVGLKTVSDCRKSCGVCPALLTVS